jgi:hypothetical protein
LRVSQLGSFRIIELEIFTPARIRNHIAANRRRLPALATMLVVSGVVLVLAPAAAASGGATGSGSGLRSAQRAENAQYHGSNSGQYHQIAASSGPNSAWLRHLSLPGVKLRNTIFPLVISPSFTVPSSIWRRKRQTDVAGRSHIYIGSQNASSISPYISSDSRPMLQLGAALGLVYVAFLAVWFWATRLRVRPPRSAPS